MSRALVLAKAPVPGQVKTRLGRDVGMAAAARLAAAALLDTLDACEAAFGECHLALAGDLGAAIDGAELRRRLDAWSVHLQRGVGLGERLAHAHAQVGAAGDGAVVQVGMDTPQVTPDLLRAVAEGTTADRAVLGPAVDGGWWVLGLGQPGPAAALAAVPMSGPDTCTATRAALEATGVGVRGTVVLRDVDTVADAIAVAAVSDGRFSKAWAELDR